MINGKQSDEELVQLIRTVGLANLNAAIDEQNPDREGLERRVKQFRLRLSKGNPPFNCINCGVLYRPKKDQYIFYVLCDTCFIPFDDQKMIGRKGNLKHGVQYFEDPQAWINATKSKK